MKNRIWKTSSRLVFIQIGAFLAAVGLEEFLVPNNILDGGVVGVSIMAGFLSGWPLGIFLLVFNAPFILLSFKTIGRRFVLLTLYAVVSLALWVTVLHPVPALTHDLFLVTVFGGICLGIGVGLIIRNGGCLDGTEIVALLLNKRVPFSVGEIIMFVNIFIFGCAGLLFGIERALYSAAAYLIAYKLIDLVVQGIDESKSVFIVTDKTHEITQRLLAEFKRGVTLLKGTGGFSGEEKNIIYLIVRRLELVRVKELVKSIDENAFLSIQNVHEVIGKNIDRRL